MKSFVSLLKSIPLVKNFFNLSKTSFACFLWIKSTKLNLS